LGNGFAVFVSFGALLSALSLRFRSGLIATFHNYTTPDFAPDFSVDLKAQARLISPPSLDGRRA
jgi:hypothetical protein